ncbi:MAG TPA: YfhO family protein [Chitinophagales bacterium]|nr:YfhO family protein [Chitinophagales bacterium]
MKEKEKQKKVAAPEKISSPNNSLLQKLLPHIIAVVVFAVITIAYFSPMILDNKVIEQGDILQGKGMSKELVDYREKTHGHEALWTNSMFGGMPAFQISVFYHGNLLLYIDKILSLGFPHPSQLPFQAMICFYILLIVMGVSPWLAIAGGIAYSLGTYNLFSLVAGHNSKEHAIALIPLFVAGIILLRSKNYWRGIILTAIGLSLQVAANHLQITFYLMLLMVVYGIVEAVYAFREKNLKNLFIIGGVGVAAAIFSVLTNLSLLWSTYSYVPSTIRGPSELTSNKQSSGGLDHDYAFQWSYGKMETFTLLIPNFYGGASDAKLSENSNLGKLLDQYQASPAQKKQYLSRAPMYFGDQPFTGGPVYAGAIVCFLFVFGLMMVKDRTRWWLLSISVLAIFLAWGRNFQWFSDIFFYHFPGYNKFRTVYMILVLVQFAFPLLGILLLNKILNHEYDKKELITKLKYSLFITGGVCLLFALFGSLFVSFKGASDAQLASQQPVLDAIIADRKSLLRMDSFRSLAFILVAAGLIWMYVTDRVKQNIFLGGIIVLMFADLFFVGERYLNSDAFVNKSDYDQYYLPSQVDDLISKDQSKDYRVLNLAANTFNDAKTSYFHKSVGGYHAAKLRRYQEIIEHQLSNDSTRHSPYPFNKSVVDMLNTKYIIVSNKQQGEQVAPNPQAMSNAWFVESIRMVNSADEEMAALNTFNPSTSVIIDKRFSAQINGLTASRDSTASITLESYEPNDLVYKSKSSKENVVVFSEIYYQPGWDVLIDGKKADHFRCNYILRGMRVPAGDHTIEFKFEPQSYFMGEKVAYASSGILVLLLLGVVGLEIFNRRKKTL